MSDDRIAWPPSTDRCACIVGGLIVGVGVRVKKILLHVHDTKIRPSCLNVKLAAQARVHWPHLPLPLYLLFKFLDVYFSITVRIGDGDRESESGTDERRYALFMK